MAKIMIVVPYAKYYKNFSWDLIQSLALEGHEVIAAAPSNPYKDELQSIGVAFEAIPIKNTGLNPFYDLFSIYKMIKVFKKHQPDLFCFYSIKPILYGSIAAAFTKSRNVLLMVTGLGYTFSLGGQKRSILFHVVKKLYTFAVDHCKQVLFENPDDLRLFQHQSILKHNRALVVNGAGVNIDRFRMSIRPVQPFVFLVVARVISDKGIEEYAEAARLLKVKYPHVVFQLLGPMDKNPTAIPASKLKSWVEEGILQYLGETEDVRPFLKRASVFVLPSYREGTPKSALEAMAMGLPIITADSPGCRETVVEAYNGFLVPVRNAPALAAAMEKFIVEPRIIPRMGLKSRELAVKKYDVRIVNTSIKTAMGLVAEPIAKNEKVTG
ncbi:glycosyltransferase family 4 protein [Paenibacillus luteus]|uniref:glycosyltransferase family 4 protein n=1 Tax=Paenibacillus luteus TaxID=2545753 RepID=UPI00114151EA|nr:glycosyltransferase family 4 protein [Paenibacillus luteus]